MIRTSLVTVLLMGGSTAWAQEKLPQKVLYVGNADSERAKEYAAFLKERFASVEVAEREGFDPSKAEKADVVLLDWSQRDKRTTPTRSPLGRRDQWKKPVVLLGSAGHLLAAAWEVHGGSG